MATFTSHIFMVQPAHFGYNPQTAESNKFQRVGATPPGHIQDKALQEFKVMVEVLKANHLQVHVFKDSDIPVTPDAVFPNNWLAIHPQLGPVVYPMKTPNRQEEVQVEFIKELGFSSYLDLRNESGQVLEGTGSMVIDYDARIIYAALSERTHEALLQQMAQKLKMQLVTFLAVDAQQYPIYHTNVMLFVTQHLVGVCLECIPDKIERERVVSAIKLSKKEILPISLLQVSRFSGNMIQLKNQLDQLVVVCSKSGWEALERGQQNKIKEYSKVISVEIPTIESVGGGSARCMIGEIFY